MKAATACPAGRLRAALYGQPAHDATPSVSLHLRDQVATRSGRAAMTPLKIVYEAVALTGNSASPKTGFIHIDDAVGSTTKRPEGAQVSGKMLGIANICDVSQPASTLHWKRHRVI